MEVIADLFLGAGALGAAFYCLILSRRLNRFKDLEQGVGGAVSVLSAQVEELTGVLTTAQEMSQGSSETLQDLTMRAETVAGRLELMMASLHDLPDADPVPEPVTPPPETGEPIFVRHARPRTVAKG